MTLTNATDLVSTPESRAVQFTLNGKPVETIDDGTRTLLGVLRESSR